MRIEKSFTVQSAPPNVWAFLTDPHRVARALPGAAIQEQIDEQTYAGTVTVKVGPVATSYKGKMRFERLDQAAGIAEIVASGQDVRGKGGAEMRMTSTVVGRGPRETEVTVVSDVNITGILAQMGRGMIEQVSDQMFQIFTDAVRAELETPQIESGVVTAATEPADPRSSIPDPPVAIPDPRPTAAAAAPPIEVVSFGSKLILSAAGRALRRPTVLIPAIALAIVLLWLILG